MNKVVCLGKIVAAHGIKGEVKFSCYTVFPFAMGHYGTVENQNKSKKFSIKIVGNTSSSNVRLKIKGIDDRNAAENLIGVELYADRNVFPPLAEDEFYPMDIIGLKVCLKQADKVVGEVVAFHNFGAGEIIEIKLQDKKQTEMLPFTKAYVPVINLDEGYIVITSETMIFAAEDEE